MEERVANGECDTYGGEYVQHTGGKPEGKKELGRDLDIDGKIILKNLKNIGQ